MSGEQGIQVRRHRPGEEDVLWDIVFQATRVSIARDYHPDLIDRWAPRDKDMEEWRARVTTKNPIVATMGDEVVGLAELEANGRIDYFYVRPARQGVGVGSALLHAVESEAKSRGWTRLFADVSVTAEPFFSSRGFAVTEARENLILGHSAPNFAMEKGL